MEEMSKKKRVYLADDAGNEHTVVFYKGKAIEMLCPELGTCAITDSE